MPREPLRLFSCLLLTACSGSGAGLDENGRPLDDPTAALTAEFASIQARVFTPYCTGCHAGAAAPLGLRLTEDASYAALVNAPSVEVPALRRIAPGAPDSSYLIQKISGTAAVGGRMPLGGPPLPADTIAAIRQWVLDGAARPSSTTPAGAPPAQLAAVFPMQAARVDFAPLGLPSAMLGAIVISADAELDASSLGTYSIQLARAGGDGGFEDGNELQIEGLQIEVRSEQPTVFAVTPPGPWVADRYRLTIAGNGALPVRDRGTQPIDGNGDSSPGGDFVLEFDVGAEVPR